MAKLKIKNTKIVIPLIMLAMMVTFFTVRSPYFLVPANIASILREAAVPGMVAVGLTFCMACGEIDLSTGSVVGFLSMFACMLLVGARLPMAVVIPAVLVAGMLCGLLNAFLIETLNLSSFIVTIATQNIFKGLHVLISFRDERGSVFTQQVFNQAFLQLGKGVGEVYYSVLMLVFMVIAAQVVLKQTKFGINLYALGSNRKAAVLSGVKESLIRRQAFAVSGACCGIAAIFLLARLGAASASMGAGLEFDAIAAVIIGGAAMGAAAEGDTNALGALVGVIFLQVLMNGIYKISMPASYQTIFRGAALILMIVVDALVAALRKYGAKRKSGKEVAS